MTDYQEIWDNIKRLFQENGMSKPSAGAWLDTAKPISLEDNVMTIQVPSNMHRNHWETKLVNDFVVYAYECTQEDIVPNIISAEDKPEKPAPSSSNAEDASSLPYRKDNAQLNEKYTFDTFVIGSGNQMAHAAALSVSEEPGKLYNPLFFFGGVGLGKTHLMHAIAHQMLENDPSLYVKYVSSEDFTNDYIQSLQKNKMDSFRERYRNVDLLLVDDIQFFANKEGTQEEFFHVFETLYNKEKQIVLTSDRSPNEIPDLQARLVSRFNWGLSVDITPPNFETRIAILRAKAVADNIDFPNETIEYIAKNIDSNIRELEGAMARVKAYARLKDEKITPDLAMQALDSLNLGNKNSQLTIPMIQEKVANYFRVSVTDLKGKKRMKTIVIPRQIAMYLSRELTESSLPEIGTEFGGKDHTTVLHSFEKIKKDIEKNVDLARQIGDIKNDLKP